MRDHHDAHLQIPKTLWEKVQHEAAIKGWSIKRVFQEALALYFRRKERGNR